MSAGPNQARSQGIRTADLERRVAELEAQIATLLKETHR